MDPGIIKNRTHAILLAFNMILLFAGWMMSVYAYPRLPGMIPLWLPFSGQPAMFFAKSFLFFVYPVAQTLFFAVSMTVAIHFLKRQRSALPLENASVEKFAQPLNLEREFILLVLIFFNLIFIHIQRSVILLAHRLEKGVSSFYFFSLFGIILLLIPYFRWRKKMIQRKKDSPRAEGH